MEHIATKTLVMKNGKENMLFYFILNFIQVRTIKDKNNWTGLLTLSIFNIDKKETYTKTCYK